MNDYSIDLTKKDSTNAQFQSDESTNSLTFKPEDQYSSNESSASPSKSEGAAEEYKTNYAENLKKYMKSSSTNIEQNTSTENNVIDQNSGNKGSWNVNNSPVNSDQKYATIGNDYSVNIAGIGDGFSNMQGAAAYTALNNNQAQRSKSEINGLKRAQQASEEARKNVGARDRAARIYNNMGDTQNYWRRKAEAQQNFYLGDVFKQKGPEYELPESPVDPSEGDNTGDILDDFEDKLKD